MFSQLTAWPFTRGSRCHASTELYTAFLLARLMCLPVSSYRLPRLQHVIAECTARRLITQCLAYRDRYSIRGLVDALFGSPHYDSTRRKKHQRE